MAADRKTVTVGIDLGTTWSVISTIDEYGKVDVLNNSEGDPKTPSVVMFEEGNPQAVVGKVAVQSAKAMPERVIAFAKRLIGREPAHTWEIDDKKYRPEEISALALRKLAQDAEQALGGDVEVRRAVITVPAYFDSARRVATRNAGEIAGLDVVGILDEPMAAAISYGLDELDQDQNIVVYDLGGGTFDVTVMRIQGGGIRVLAKGGNAELGGKDWDDVLVKYAAGKFERQHGEDPTDDPVSYQALYDAALMAKESLSRVNRTRLVVNHEGTRMTVDVTRDEFDSLTAGLLSQTRATLEAILSEVPDIGSWKEIDKVLLVGGSTKMPQVKQMVEAVTGREIKPEVDVDTCVAKGAALFAMSMPVMLPEDDETEEEKQAREDMEEERLRLAPDIREKVRGMQLASVSSRFFGILAHDVRKGRDVNSILIKKNAPIPADVTKTYRTLEPSMTRIPIEVLECEEEIEELRGRDDPRVVRIVDGHISGIPPGLPAEHPVDVRLQFCEDGTLQVHAMTQVEGRQYDCHLEATPAGGMTQVELEQAVAEVAALAVS